MRLIIYLTAILMPLNIYASSTGALPTAAVVKENVDLFTWVLGIAILVVLYLLHRVISAHEDNAKKQWEKLGDHEGRLNGTEKDIVQIKQKCADAHPGGQRWYDPPNRPSEP
jgi:hypothetical protein